MVVVVVVVQECEVLLVIPVDGMHAVDMRILRMRLRKMMVRDGWWWYGVIGEVLVVNKVDDIMCGSMRIRSGRMGIG